jgi:hypothetical protein
MKSVKRETCNVMGEDISESVSGFLSFFVSGEWYFPPYFVSLRAAVRSRDFHIAPCKQGSRGMETAPTIREEQR